MISSFLSIMTFCLAKAEYVPCYLVPPAVVEQQATAQLNTELSSEFSSEYRTKKYLTQPSCYFYLLNIILKVLD